VEMTEAGDTRKNKKPGGAKGKKKRELKTKLSQFTWGRTHQTVQENDPPGATGGVAGGANESEIIMEKGKDDYKYIWGGLPGFETRPKKNPACPKRFALRLDMERGSTCHKHCGIKACRRRGGANLSTNKGEGFQGAGDPKNQKRAGINNT